MALGTYSQLKTSIETWMARSGDPIISGNAADCVTLAEDRLNTELPLRIMIIDTTLTGTPGSRSVALPSDYVEPKALFVTIGGQLTPLQPKIAGTFTYRTTTGVPVAWDINGSNIDLDCLLDSAYSFTFRYRQAFALSDGAPTNWLLTNHPTVYLAGCLVQACLLTGKDPSLWQSVLNQRMDEVKKIDRQGVKIAPLTVDAGLIYPMRKATGYFNYASGQ